MQIEMDIRTWIVIYVVHYLSCMIVSGYKVGKSDSEVGTSFKYTIEELQSREFPRKVSTDIFMDPCKAGKFDKYKFCRYINADT